MRKWLFGAAMVTLAAGCASEPTPVSASCVGDKCDELSSGWVVDMRKIAPYGQHSDYFWGLSYRQLNLGDLEGAIDAQNMDAGAKQAFSAFGAEDATFKIVWDQIQSVAQGWPTVVFSDAATATAKLPALNAALPQVAEGLAAMGTKYSDGMEYRIVLIDESGRALAVPGGLKIIPMLKDTSPKDQVHIKAALDNGDVISYVHPEDTSMAGLMERRASHVAMHYEEGDIVHHIDNPNGYGPPYNHAPSRHMPFHAFRFQPKGMSAEAASQHSTAARNWAFMTNDISPFADFFDLRLQQFSDLDKFSGPAVRNDDIPELYCSGLAYANLNLGVNKPQNEAGLGSDYSTFQGNTYTFSDTGKDYAGGEFQAAASLNPMGSLVFEPYTSIDMLNVWVGNTFRGLPPALQQGFLPEFLKNPDLHSQIGGALRALNWSDADSGSTEPAAGWTQVANKFNVAAWGTAYSMELLGQSGADFIGAGVKVVDKDGIEKTIQEVVTDKGILSTGSPLDVMKAVYEKVVENRFVPPRIWIDQGQTYSNNIMDPASPTRNMGYIGTVINCELLSAADGSNADACDGGGLGADEYAEGGADTHTYSHYAVRNNGNRTHRRIDASAGPESYGPGTVVTVRYTGNSGDTAFALHVPQHWQELPAHAGDSIVDFDAHCNGLWENSETCAPSKGIYLEAGNKFSSGDVHNKELKFALVGESGSPCEVVDDKTLSCQVIDLATKKVTTEDVSRISHGVSGYDGHFTATMIDLGEVDESSDCSVRDDLDAENPGRANGCMSEAGSGHYDVFHIKVRNDSDS